MAEAELQIRPEQLKVLELAKQYQQQYTKLLNDYSKGKMNEDLFNKFVSLNEELKGKVKDPETANFLHDRLSLPTFRFEKGKIVGTSAVQFDIDRSNIDVMRSKINYDSVNQELKAKGIGLSPPDRAELESKRNRYATEVIKELGNIVDLERIKKDNVSSDPKLKRNAAKTDLEKEKYENELEQMRATYVIERAQNDSGLLKILQEFYKDYAGVIQPKTQQQTTKEQTESIKTKMQVDLNRKLMIYSHEQDLKLLNIEKKTSNEEKGKSEQEKKEIRNRAEEEKNAISKQQETINEVIFTLYSMMQTSDFKRK